MNRKQSRLTAYLLTLFTFLFAATVLLMPQTAMATERKGKPGKPHIEEKGTLVIHKVFEKGFEMYQPKEIDVLVKGPGGYKKAVTLYRNDGYMKTIKYLRPGTYQVHEESLRYWTPKENPVKAKVYAGKTAHVWIKNMIKPATLTIKKHFIGDHERDSLPEIKVWVTGYNFKKEYTLNKDNNWTVAPKLRPGKYFVKEVVPTGWKAVDDDHWVFLTPAEKETVHFYNKPAVVNGTLTISKTFERGFEKYIPKKVVLDVKGPNGYEKVVIFNHDNKYAPQTLLDLKPGKYTITERPLDNWYPVKRTIEVTIESGEKETICFENKIKRGSIVINKRFAAKYDYHTLPEEIKVEVYYEGKCIDTVTLYKKDGYKSVKLDNMLPGNYTLKELLPAKWTAEVNPIMFCLEPGECKEICFVNMKVRGN